MDHRITVTRFGATVEQTLLAATLDLEQRWEFLTPEDRVEALTDLIALTLIYIRAFSDGVASGDHSTLAFTKGASDAVALAESAVRDVSKHLTDAATLADSLNRIVDYTREYAEDTQVSDLMDSLVSWVRGFADTVESGDSTSLEPGKYFYDSGELYAESGYFADDYWAYTGPRMSDASTWSFAANRSETVPLIESFSSVRSFTRLFDELPTILEQFALNVVTARADTFTPSDSSSLVNTLGKTESVVAADDLALLDFSRRVEEWVSTPDVFSGQLTKPVTDSALATDAPYKTFSALFMDIGGLYSEASYFADDYVAPGTGPVVSDSFSYTLA